MKEIKFIKLKKGEVKIHPGGAGVYFEYPIEFLDEGLNTLKDNNIRVFITYELLLELGYNILPNFNYNPLELKVFNYLENEIKTEDILDELINGTFEKKFKSSNYKLLNGIDNDRELNELTIEI